MIKFVFLEILVKTGILNCREAGLEATEQLGGCFGTAVREDNGLEECGKLTIQG